ncbi:hypothetical protein MN608_09098 [Microdochium nivale]|nr:hypothetical protein MN608_09098 [Microdochium nivale]
MAQQFTVPTHSEDIGQQVQAVHPDLDPDSWVRPVPRMTIAGPPNDIIFDCPGSRALDYEATWYFLPAVPDFLICTRCFERHVRGSSIAAQFHSVRLSGKETDSKETDSSRDGAREGGNKCCFNTPRLTQDLMSQAKASGDLGPVEEYMARRVSIKTCPGTNRVRALDGFKWFDVASMTTTDDRPLPEIYKDVLVCEACYEDQVLGSSFAAKFGPVTRAQPGDQLWPCDFGATPFFGKAFRWFSQLENQKQIHHHQVGDVGSTTRHGLADTNWLELANMTSPRWRLPACDGFRKAVDPASRKWFRARQLPELFLCEACHLDEVKFTPLEAHFEPADVASKTGSAWMDAALGYATEGEFPPRVCQGKSRPILIALGIALRRRDAGVLVGDVIGPTILRSPVCTDQGLEDATSLAKLTGGKWYRLLASGPCGDNRDGDDNTSKFRICEACHACLARALGLERYWEAEEDAGGGRRLVCGLHPGAPRGSEYLARLDEAVDTGVWARFETYVRVWIDIPPCPRNLLHNNVKENSRARGRRKWYGWKDCLICAECFVKFCEPLAVRTAGATTTGGGRQQQRGHDVDDVAGRAGDLLSFLPMQNEHIGAAGETGIMCCMCSPRMRELFRAVVEEKLDRSVSVDDSNSVAATTTTATTAETALLEHSRIRHAVHARTIPRLRMIREVREMAMLQSLHSGMLGLMYQGAGAMQTISGTAADAGYLYGSSGGWGGTRRRTMRRARRCLSSPVPKGLAWSRGRRGHDGCEKVVGGVGGCGVMAYLGGRRDMFCFLASVCLLSWKP